MLRFVRDSYSVKVDPLSLTLAPLLRIWTEDTSTDKKEAAKILTYLHLVSQIDQAAPYSKVNPNEVRKFVKKDIWGDYAYEIVLGALKDDEIEEAIMAYQLSYESPEEASVRSFNKKIYEIRKVIDETKVEIKTSTDRGRVSYVSNFPILNKMMQDLTKIVKARDELKALIMKESTRESIKGNQKLSYADKVRQKMAAAGSKKAESEKEESEPIPTEL